MKMKAVQTFLTEQLRRVSTWIGIVAILACLGVWAVDMRLAVLENVESAVVAADLRAREAITVRAQLPTRRIDEQNELYMHAGNRFLRDFDHLASWLTTLTTRAATLGLTVNHVVGKAKSGSVGFEGMELLPVQFTIESSVGDQSLDVFIKYLQILTEEEIIAEIARFTVTGHERGPEGIDLDLRVWIQTEKVPT